MTQTYEENAIDKAFDELAACIGDALGFQPSPSLAMAIVTEYMECRRQLQ